MDTYNNKFVLLDKYNLFFTMLYYDQITKEYTRMF